MTGFQFSHESNGTGWATPVPFGSYERLNLHVSESLRCVVRAVSCRIFRREFRFTPEHRRARKAIYRGFIAHHLSAIQTYRAVMTGDFS